MIFIRASIIDGTNEAYSFYELAYLANNVRCAVDAIFGEWRVLIQPHDDPKEVFMVWKELVKMNEEKEIAHKVITFYSYIDLFESISKKQKEIYTEEYNRLRGME